MSNEPIQTQVNADVEDKIEEPKFDELALLKARATVMGVSFSNNIGVDALKKRIQEKIDSEDADQVISSVVPAQAPTEQTHAVATQPVKTIRQHMVDTNMKLVRVRITCLDPKKKSLYGEIFTVANEYLGTVCKFVPFGEFTDNGFHIPYCLFKLMDKRKFLSVYTTKDKHNGPQVHTRWAKEFSLEILPQLTEAELAQLRTDQAARAGGTE